VSAFLKGERMKKSVVVGYASRVKVVGGEVAEGERCPSFWRLVIIGYCLYERNRLCGRGLDLCWSADGTGKVMIRSCVGDADPRISLSSPYPHLYLSPLSTSSQVVGLKRP